MKKEDADEVTEKSLLAEILAKSKVNITSFLPSGYKSHSSDSSKASSQTTERSLEKEKNKASIQDLFVKSEVDVSAFLPRDFKQKKNSTDTQNTQPQTIEKNPLQDLFVKSEVDISAFIPKDYVQKVKNSTEETRDFDQKNNESDKAEKREGGKETKFSSVTPSSTTTKTGGIKLVFPSRPGGRKPSAKITTPHTPRGEGAFAAAPKIQKGWPTRYFYFVLNQCFDLFSNS